MKLNLEGKIAIITGGSRGIGKSIKDTLENEGVKVYSISRTENFDLSKYIGIQQARNYIKQIKPNILINNVGGGGRVIDLVESYDLVNNINIRPMIHLTYEAIQTGRLKRVITIASIFGKEAGLIPQFTSTKAYEIAFMKEMARKYRHTNMTFNTVSPGEIDVGKVDKKEHFGEPKDVANIVVFLCSNLAKHINGANIVVDRGYSYSF